MSPISTATAPSSSMNDDIVRAQRGDMEAFERIYRSHVGRVNALCIRLTAGHGADDLLQDVFVRVWEKLPSFRGDSALGSWMHRLAVNVFLASKRAELRREAWESTAEEPDAVNARTGPDREDPHARIDLERAIARLPAGARTAFVLHDLEGYRHEEIAEMQGVAAATVRVQLHRARRLLMRELES